MREAIWRGLIYVAEEMGIILQKKAVSPNIRDRLDFSCAVLDKEGRMIAQAEHIPVHLGSMAVSGKELVSRVKDDGFYVTNDPYLVGTHLNDVTMIAPVRYEDETVAWVACKAHYVDLGGSPGSLGGRSIYEEGLLIPPMKVYDENGINMELVELIKANSRVKDVEIDLIAQVEALKAGIKGVKEIIKRYGLESFEGSLRWSVDYVRRYARESLEEGEGFAEDYVELPEGEAKITAEVKIREGEARVRLDGDEQVEYPFNAVYQVSVASTTYVIKSLFDPEMPVNQGFYEVVKIEARRGSIVNAVRPAPVSAYTETAQRIVDVVLKAIGEFAVIPAASGGTMTNVAFAGKDWAFYETVGTGSGGRPFSDGVDGVHVNMTNTLNTPIEVIEAMYPIKIIAYKLREGSGGKGKYRGGLGIVRAYKVLEDCEVSLAGNRVRRGPWGVYGGESGKPARYYVIREGKEIELGPFARIKLRKGDILVVETPGGGGFGDPCERERELIERDLREGKYKEWPC